VTKVIKVFKETVFSKISFKIQKYFDTLPYFCTNFFVMEVKRRSRGIYWILFFISVAALALAIITHWPWLTLILPFVTTFFVLAMDII
jgi:hypothetical protein